MHSSACAHAESNLTCTCTCTAARARAQRVHSSACAHAESNLTCMCAGPQHLPARRNRTRANSVLSYERTRCGDLASVWSGRPSDDITSVGRPRLRLGRRCHLLRLLLHRTHHPAHRQCRPRLRRRLCLRLSRSRKHRRSPRPHARPHPPRRPHRPHRLLPLSRSRHPHRRRCRLPPPDTAPFSASA